MNKMLFQLLSSLALLLFILSFTAKAQNKIRTTGKSTNPTVITDKSGVYVTFERFGKRTPLRDDEDGEGVWLRLNNNMHHSVSVCVFGISDEGEELITYRKGAQIGLKYDVVLNPVSITNNQSQPNVPIGYNTGDTCNLFRIKSGKSMLFAVPSEHLVKGLSIKIFFIYEWEDETVNNPTHLVYFNSANIPKQK